MLLGRARAVVGFEILLGLDGAACRGVDFAGEILASRFFAGGRRRSAGERSESLREILGGESRERKVVSGLKRRRVFASGIFENADGFRHHIVLGKKNTGLEEIVQIRVRGAEESRHNVARTLGIRGRDCLAQLVQKDVWRLLRGLLGKEERRNEAKNTQPPHLIQCDGSEYQLVLDSA